jgi:asparagine synthase (glutamine-hydrolysing)
MCGISISGGTDRSHLISHRGTEHKTIMVDHIRLSHHRLPIQTMDNDEWAMPYEYAPDLYLLFNGEIFNYDTDKFGSDTEYLISFFRNVGSIDLDKLVEHQDEISTWDGFWSIVLYDAKTKMLTAMNDPLGKKQLYVNAHGEICSEIEPLIRPYDTIDNSYIGAIHKFGYNHDGRTPWNRIKRLDPKIWYNYRFGQPRYMRTAENVSLEPNGSGDLKSILVESVKRRLLSKNYPISVLLSGGLDSTIITSILQDLGADVTYYTIDNGEDEYVKLCEDYWGIKVNRLTYDLSDESKLTEIYCKWNETPVDLGSVIPQYHLFDAVAKTGHRIVLSGDGADELFGGYRRIDEFDSQGSDIYDELTYYHLPRLDRMSMAHTIELRNPFLGHDVIRFARALDLEDRTHKSILKDAFKDDIPKEILDRTKAPLKNDSIKKDRLKYRKKVLDLFVKNHTNK